jgi:hypothetical protein
MLARSCAFHSRFPIQRGRKRAQLTPPPLARRLKVSAGMRGDIEALAEGAERDLRRTAARGHAPAAGVDAIGTPPPPPVYSIWKSTNGIYRGC